MNPRSLVLRARVPMLAVLFLTHAAAAQLFDVDFERPRPVQSLTAGYSIIDFAFDGHGTPQERFDFDDVAYGLTYTRSFVSLSVAYGTHASDDPEARDLHLLDFTLKTWGELFPFHNLVSKQARFFVPVTVHSTYRRSARAGNENSLVDAFNVTTIGLGAGLGSGGQTGAHFQYEVRAVPVAALALRNFGGGAGSSFLFDGDVVFHLIRLSGRVGLTCGYTFRWQVWNVGGSSLLKDVDKELYDYRSMDHTIHLGVNW